jgi:hypothetical protein
MSWWELALVPLLVEVCHFLQALCLAGLVLLARSTLRVDLLVLEVLVLSTWLVDPVLAVLVAMLFSRAVILQPLPVVLFPFCLELANPRVDQFTLTLELCQAARVVPFHWHLVLPSLVLLDPFLWLAVRVAVARGLVLM